MRSELIDLSHEVWRRTRSRLDGLTDDEYLWEPAPGCWSVRERPDGTQTIDWPLPRPEPEPFTTIAWRLWHLIDMYGENRAPRWLDVPPQGQPIGMDDPNGSPPATAAGALRLLEAAHARWDAHLALTTEESLAARVGDIAGRQYSDRTRAAYVLHMLDEFIHHGAEISLLRDLWRWQRPVAVDPLIERIMRGDDTMIAELDSSASSDLVDIAAKYGRWDLVVELVRIGVRVSTTGRTPLHLAAGAGELKVVEYLLEHGADAMARDPEFHATARQWAEFLAHPAVVSYFDAIAES